MRHILKFSSFALIALCFCFLSSGVSAATQGTTTLGASTGTLDVTVTTGLVSRVSGLADIDLGTWSGSGDLSATENLCIGRSGVGLFAQGPYRMRLDGDGSPYDINAFTLTNGVDLLHYEVMFNDATGQTGQIPVTAGVMFGGQGGFGFWQILNLVFGCVVNNASVTVNLSEAELGSAPSGNYTGTLTLVLIPE